MILRNNFVCFAQADQINAQELGFMLGRGQLQAIVVDIIVQNQILSPYGCYL